jgi:hypothetical protein
MNSAKHRQEGSGGDTLPKRLRKSVCARVMERDAEREGYLFMVVEKAARLAQARLTGSGER